MSVQLGDDATYLVRGVGSISFQTPIGDVLELSNVLYVPRLKKNLLSILFMVNLQSMAKFDAQEVIFRRQTHEAKAVRARGLYKLQADPLKHSTLVHDNTKLCELWHRCLGHLHYRGLAILKKLVKGLLDFKIDKEVVCKGCALCKHVKITFLTSDHRSRGSLDLIHLNVCGPMSFTSLTDSSYYVTFIDDFSCRT